jgi:hypothetical protein
VPRDASAVLVLGPTMPFLREEVEALVRWVRGGGRLLVALDPESGSQFDALLQPLGVRFVPTTLVNDRVYLARTHQPSDRAQLVTATFGPHASVGTLVRASGRLPVFLLGAGSLEQLTQKPAGVNVVFTVTTLPETFRDLDGNYVQDPRTEKRKAWDVAAAITLPRKGSDEGRAVVVADSDAFTDLVLDASQGNRVLALDGVRWLLGEESLERPAVRRTSHPAHPGTGSGVVLRHRLRGAARGAGSRLLGDAPRRGRMRGARSWCRPRWLPARWRVAAAVWLRPPPQGAPGEVPVAALARGEVKTVRWDDGSHLVTVTRGGDPDRTVWVHIATSPSVQPPDAGPGTASEAGVAGSGPRGDAGAAGLRADGGARGRADAGVTDAPRAIREAPPPPPRDLRGNETAEQLLDRVSPPMATRDLGAITPARRTELGLEASSKRLWLDTGQGLSGPGRTLEFVVSTPPGAAGAYLLSPDGHLWLIHESLVQDLSAAASRLVDRRLHAFRSDEPDALQIQLDGRIRAFVVRRAQGSTRVAPAENPDAPSADATAWADRVWRLAPLEVLGRGETSREGTPSTALRVEYTRDRKPLGFLELGRAGAEWFARTEHTAGWVRLPPQSASLREQAERLEAGAPSTTPR